MNPGNNLHVSGLHTKVDSRDLEAAFAKAGRVRSSSSQRALAVYTHQVTIGPKGLDHAGPPQPRISRVRVRHDGVSRGGRGSHRYAELVRVDGQDYERRKGWLIYLAQLHRLRPDAVFQARRGRARTPTPGRYYGPPKRRESALLCFPWIKTSVAYQTSCRRTSIRSQTVRQPLRRLLPPS